MSKVINVEITGIASLLQHRYPIEEQGENKKKSAKKVYVPEEEAEKACYRDETGFLFEPAEHIFGALTRTATGFIFDKRKTYKDVVKGGVLVEPEQISLGVKKWDEIDTRRAVVQRSAVVRYRPKFNKGWKMSFNITILDDENIDETVLKDILDKAGASCGIGDYRPRFGRFQVTKWDVQK